MNGLGRLAVCVSVTEAAAHFNGCLQHLRNYASSVVSVSFRRSCCHLQAVKTRSVAKGHMFCAEAQTVK